MVRVKWADRFFEEADAKGLQCKVVNRVNEWPETMVVRDKRYFVKSVKYNIDRKLYFQGVDTGKLSPRNQKGDFVLICGGIENGIEISLRDIFIIPWKDFFQTLGQGAPVNTYKPPKKEYLQYKFRLTVNRGKWAMKVQGGSKPELDIDKWRFDPDAAIERLRGNE